MRSDKKNHVDDDAMIIVNYLVKSLNLFHSLKINPVFMTVLPVVLHAEQQGKPIMVSALAAATHIHRTTLMRNLQKAPDLLI